MATNPYRRLNEFELSVLADRIKDHFDDVRRLRELLNDPNADQAARLALSKKVEYDAQQLVVFYDAHNVNTHAMLDLLDKALARQQMIEDAYMQGGMDRMKDLLRRLPESEQVLLIQLVEESNQPFKRFVSNDPDLTDTDEDRAAEDAVLLRFFYGLRLKDPYHPDK